MLFSLHGGALTSMLPIAPCRHKNCIFDYLNRQALARKVIGLRLVKSRDIVRCGRQLSLVKLYISWSQVRARLSPVCRVSDNPSFCARDIVDGM